MKNEPKEIVALYVRVSTDKQDTDMQREALNKEVEKQDMRVYKTYDDTKTGSSEHRKDFDEMIADAKAGKFTKLLLWKLDRFSRSVRVGLQVLFELEKIGIKIFILNEPNLNTDSQGSKMARNMVLMGAEMQHDSIKLNTRTGFARYIKQGHWPFSASPPFGYICRNKKWAEQHNELPDYKLYINPEQAKVVKRIFNLYVNSNLSMRKILKVLNDEKLPPPVALYGPKKIKKRPNVWYKDMVGRILDNEIYTGRKMIGKHWKDEDTGEMRGLGKIYEFECPEIISRELFDRAKEKKMERLQFGYNIGRSKRDYLLRGFIRCGKCRFPLHPSTAKRHKDFVFYFGRGDAHINPQRCSPYCGSIGEGKLIETIANGFNTSLCTANEEELNKMFKNDDYEEVKALIDRHEGALKKLNEKRQRIIQNYEDGHIEIGDKRSKILAIDNEIKIVKDRISEANQRILTKSEQQEILELYKDYYKAMNLVVKSWQRSDLKWSEERESPIKLLSREESYIVVKTLLDKMILKAIYVDWQNKKIALHTNIFNQLKTLDCDDRACTNSFRRKVKLERVALPDTSLNYQPEQRGQAYYKDFVFYFPYCSL